jgi:hypothetical protein
MDDYAQMAKVRLGQETGALLSNQANLDYEGRAYDGIMLNTYKALNYLRWANRTRPGRNSSAPTSASKTPFRTTRNASKKFRLKPPRTRIARQFKGAE